MSLIKFDEAFESGVCAAITNKTGWNSFLVPIFCREQFCLWQANIFRRKGKDCTLLTQLGPAAQPHHSDLSGKSEGWAGKARLFRASPHFLFHNSFKLREIKGGARHKKRKKRRNLRTASQRNRGGGNGCWERGGREKPAEDATMPEI